MRRMFRLRPATSTPPKKRTRLEDSEVEVSKRPTSTTTGTPLPATRERIAQLSFHADALSDGTLESVERHARITHPAAWEVQYFLQLPGQQAVSPGEYCLAFCNCTRCKATYCQAVANSDEEGVAMFAQGVACARGLNMNRVFA